jgi:RNA recognition motif-containing protein
MIAGTSGINNTSETQGASLLSKVANSPSTVFIGDLPKDVTQVELYEYIRRALGNIDIEFDLILKR